MPSKYADFVDIFSPKLAVELLEYMRINNHAIKLVVDWQPLYGLIYRLESVDMETLKTYINNNLANGFIKLSKSSTGALIFFDKKLHKSLRLYVNYRGFNNLTIKNWYPLPLIGKSLDLLGRASRFIQLNLTNAYHWRRIREGNEWKTAFRTRYSHFKYQVIPFGLTNISAMF